MKAILLLTATISCLISSPKAGASATNNSFNVETLNKTLKETNAGWVAKDNNITPADAKRMMGLDREASDGVDFAKVTGFTRADLPTVLDWRNKNGSNWVSPMLNQANCGSCVAFASIGVLESMVNIASGIPNTNVHLSAQNLFACGGGYCEFGWQPGGAASYLQETGVPDEACMPYTSGATSQDVSCSATCADTASRSVKIAGYSTPSRSVRDVEAVKQALQSGPVVTTLSVYADFVNYSSGVYKHTVGDVLGGHAISIVGYDDTKQAYIVRNSWGHEWGQDGFGYVSYEDVSGVGDQTWSYQMPTYSGAVATVTPIDYTYTSGNLNVKSTSTFAGTASMSASLISTASHEMASATCQSPCETAMSVAAIPDGRYDFQVTAHDSSGKALGTSVKHMVYIANTQPKIAVSFKGKNVDLTQPLKDRVEFDITTSSTSVPLSSLVFHYKGPDGVEKTKTANVVLNEMSLGWRTNMSPNGTYEIWMVGHLDTVGSSAFNEQIETPHMTVTTSN